MVQQSNADMPPQDFRRAGRHLVDWIADYLEDPRPYPVAAPSEPGALRCALSGQPPLKGDSIDAILRDFEDSILPHITHWNHPRFHAWFSITSSGPGILGELLTAALDANAMLWKSCPAATELEQGTLAWVLEWLQLPAEWFGMIVDSASTAVLQAIVAARQRAEPRSREAGSSNRLVAYVSEHTHSSAEKAAITAGIGQSNVRHVPVDSGFRMRPDALERAIRSDLARQMKPFFAVATFGTTSTTAVDPVAEIAAICRANGLWLHVHGAYGGTFGLLPECRHLLDGAEMADSFVVNAHKMMLVPLDCSLLYTRHPEALRTAFALAADYLATDAVNVVDYADYGLALGRRFRALKLWFVMRYFGRDGLAAILREKLKMAAWLGEQIAYDHRFELLAPATMGLVCFRAREGDAATMDLMRRVNSSGSFVSHTRLSGRLAIRIAIGNIRTNQSDVEQLWAAIAGS